MGSKPSLLHSLTIVAVVVHQDDFFEEVGGGPVHGCVDGAQDDGQSLIHKDKDNADLGEVGGIGDVPAPEEKQQTLGMNKDHKTLTV